MENIQEKYDLIESSIRYIQRLSIGSKKEIENNRLKGSMNLKSVTEISEGLIGLLKAVVLTSDITNLSNAQSIDKIKDCITGLLEACENNDVIYVTDMLEYEILPILEEWRQVLVAAYKEKR